MKAIPINKFMVRVHDLWLNRWFLLTTGDYDEERYNTMTVAWGYFGIMWNKPIAVVVVRPTRYTYRFINTYETFTLCAFPKKYKDDLLHMGSTSGRDGDKISGTKLHIIQSQKVASPSFKEAELIIECKKVYWDDFKPSNFLDTSIEENYPEKDYHRFYFGEIVGIIGDERYRVEP